jgi:hypothetical protein
MKAYSEYWAATMMRGFIAIVISTGVLFIREMASAILLLPFAIAISILCLAAYGVIDSAIIFTTSFMIPAKKPGRFALRLQGICGAAIGILLFAVVYDHVDLRWFLYLAAIQAAGLAVTEFIVATGTSIHHGICARCRDFFNRSRVVRRRPQSPRTSVADLWVSRNIRLQSFCSVRADALR